jgi:hypothetical protein
MKKILITSILLSFPTFQAQQTLADNTFFTNLIGKEFENFPSEHQNYKISNTLTPSGWVLDTNWWGGINFKTQGSIKLHGNVEVTNSIFKVVNNNNLLAYEGLADIIFRFEPRGSGGRAIVHDNGNILTLNYENDFTGGTKLGTSFLVKNNNASLEGKFEAQEIKVTLTPTADFVFAEDYDLPKLEDVERHIKEKKHLPEIASAKQMEKEGVNVGEFQIKLLQKIEELTLYTIEQNKLIKEQQKRIETLEKNYKSKK